MSFTAKAFLNQYKNIIKNSFFLCIIDGIRLVMPFIALPYMLNIIGSENYGKIVFSQTVVTYFAITVNFGLNIYTVKRFADNLDSPLQMSIISSTLIALRLLLALAGLSVLTAMVILFPLLKSLTVLLYFSYLTVFAEAITVTSFFQSIQRMGNITFIQTFSILFYVAALFIFVKEKADYIFIPLLQSLGLLLAGLISVAIMHCQFKVRLTLPHWKDITEMCKQSFPFALSRIAVVANNNMTRLFAGITLSMHDLALLDMAQKISDTAQMPASILDQAIYPHNAQKQDRKFATRTFFLMAVLGIVCACIMLLGTPWAVKILGAGKLNEAIPLTYILSFKVFLAVMSFYTGTPLLVAFGHAREFNSSILFSTIISVLLYAVLFGLSALSLKMFVFLLIISEAAVFIYRTIYCIKFKIITINNFRS